MPSSAPPCTWRRNRPPAETRLTTAADVYSLGAILYWLFTGKPAIQAASPLEMLQQVQEQEPVRPRSLNLELDRDLETICLKCLEKDPSRRYGSAEALADELDRWLAGEPIQARPVSTLERAWRRCRRNPLVGALLAAVVLVAAAGLVGVLGQWQVAVANEQKAVASAQEAKEKAQEATTQRDEAQRQRDEVRRSTISSLPKSSSFSEPCMRPTSTWHSKPGRQAASGAWCSCWSNTAPRPGETRSARLRVVLSLPAVPRAISSP